MLKAKRNLNPETLNINYDFEEVVIEVAKNVLGDQWSYYKLKIFLLLISI